VNKSDTLGVHRNKGKETVAKARSSFLFCGCGYLTGFIVTRNKWRDKMIKRGAARYRWQTGKWEWGEPAKGLKILKCPPPLPAAALA
jgi:hypothetical protein